MKKKEILLLTTILLASCSNETRYFYYATLVNDYINMSLPTLPFDTSSYIQMYSNENYFEDTLLFDNTIKELHKVLDNANDYRNINNAKTINESNGEYVEVSDDLTDILKTSIQMTKLTNGYFNFTMGELIDLYEEKFETIGIRLDDPDKELINSAMDNIVSINELDSLFDFSEEKQIKMNLINDKTINLSLGAIAKGYALDKLKLLYKDNNKPMIINLGNSSIMTLNNNPYESNWSIGVKLPSLLSVDMAFTLNIKGSNMFSTSADNEKYYYTIDDNENEILRSHIINPFTGYSSNYHRQIFLYSSSASGAVLDSLSTALMNVEKISDIKEIISNVNNYYSCNINYCIFDNDQEFTYKLFLNQEMRDNIVDISPKITAIEIV